MPCCKASRPPHLLGRQLGHELRQAVIHVCLDILMRAVLLSHTPQQVQVLVLQHAVCGKVLQNHRNLPAGRGRQASGKVRGIHPPWHTVATSRGWA